MEGISKAVIVPILSINTTNLFDLESLRPYPHPRSAEYILGLAAMRGSQWGVNYAEGFECVLRCY